MSKNVAPENATTPTASGILGSASVRKPFLTLKLMRETYPHGAILKVTGYRAATLIGGEKLVLDFGEFELPLSAGNLSRAREFAGTDATALKGSKVKLSIVKVKWQGGNVDSIRAEWV